MDRYNVRPGLLVALSTQIKGGVSYVRNDKGTEREGAAECRQWETIQTTTDKEEHERAKQARNAGRSAVARVCVQTPFGLVCPVDREADLQRAIDDAGASVREFNQTAQYSRVELFAIVGRIAANDAEAARAILGDVREALDGMRAGIKDLDPDAVREAASRARQIGRMLDDAQGERVTEAVNAARRAAREIAKAVEDGAANVAEFKLGTNTEPLDSLRFAFLDVDEPTTVKVAGDGAETSGELTGFEEFPEPEPEAPAVVVQRFAGLEVQEEQGVTDNAV